MDEFEEALNRLLDEFVDAGVPKEQLLAALERVTETWQEHVGKPS